MLEAEARILRHWLVAAQETQVCEKARQVALETLERMLPFLLMSDF